MHCNPNDHRPNKYAALAPCGSKRGVYSLPPLALTPQICSISNRCSPNPEAGKSWSNRLERVSGTASDSQSVTSPAAGAGREGTPCVRIYYGLAPLLRQRCVLPLFRRPMRRHSTDVDIDAPQENGFSSIGLNVSGCARNFTEPARRHAGGGYERLRAKKSLLRPGCWKS